MFRNYQEYENFFKKMIKNAPKNIKFNKLSPEEFEYQNYVDKIEWYLCEEYNLDPFTDIFFGHGDPDSETMTPKEILYDGYYNKCRTIIDKGYENKISVNQTAYKVLVFLKKNQVIA